MSAEGEAAFEPPEALLEKVQALPAEPGVYLFRSERGVVLYVGKAQSLRARVRSYFQAGGDGRYSMHFLLPRIADLEVVVTNNVKEALLLENQLIKKHRPRFNVQLRDDKNYLGLRLDPRERYPRFTETRRFLRDGALYFGPYTSSRSLRQTLRSLQKIFPLRTCSDAVFREYQRQGRPCLEHSVGRCAAPCVGLIEDAAYAELVDGAIRLMRGQSAELIRELDERMREAAEDERFEEAARLRDRVQAIERTTQQQAMVSPNQVDRDIFGLARDGRRLEIQALYVRQGKLLGGRVHSFSDVRIDDAMALDSFLSQFYQGDRDIPRQLLLPLAVDGREALQALLRERTGGAVSVEVPQRGERRRLVEMAERNAALALSERSRREQDSELIMAELAVLLGLASAPRRVECYDTSHLQGDLHVASRVVFQDGVPEKGGYRRYKLREAQPGDDYGALREVLSRRLQKLERDPAPDLLVLDGGKGQLGMAVAVVEDLGLDELALVSIAKERDEEASSPRVRRHGGSKRERLFLPGVKDPLQPPSDSRGLLFLQRVRDESHRFAIRYHRELRRKLALRSVLEELPGIGPVKRRALLRTLGSLEAVKSASEEELARVPKISRADAELIARFFAAPAAPLPIKDGPAGDDSSVNRD